MKITIESTTQTVWANGVECRVWEGETEHGVKVQCLIPRIVARQDQDLTQFEAELKRAKEEIAEYDRLLREAETIPTRELVLVNMHQDIMRLREALEEIGGYRHHLSFCEYEMTEFCTCGMKQAADKCRAALEAI